MTRSSARSEPAAAATPDDLPASPRKQRHAPASRRRPAAAGEAGSSDEFDEVTYLRAFPDVLDAVDRGDLASGREHYMLSGKTESRLEKPEYRRLRLAEQHGGPSRNAAFAVPAVNVDTLALSRSGAVLLVGWADDRGNPLTAVTVMSGGRPYSVWTHFPRLRRVDVGRALDGDILYRYGFWVFAAPNQRRAQATGVEIDECLIELHFASGAVAEVRRQPQTIDDRDLRDNAMGRLAVMAQPENRTGDGFTGLDGRVGSALVEFNRVVSHGSLSGTISEQFGPRRPRYRGSIIVSLEHSYEPLFLHGCVYGGGRGIEDYEFIYLTSRPDLVEPALREARIADLTYGLPVTILLLPAGTVASAGLNAAARLAQSDRLLFIRPDVFPRETDWARQHTDLLGRLPAAQTRLFGTSLYYDNGSLRSAGYYFEHDTIFHSGGDSVVRHADLRTEAYGKGAPAWATQFTRSRPVSALSGAFISVDRGWFEKLGGISECYQGGQYEDIDLCLRSLREGVPPWLHAIPMTQLDLGTPALPQADEPGAILNRWWFRQRWAAFIDPDLLGRTPRHPLLREVAAEGPALTATTAMPSSATKLRLEVAHSTGPLIRALGG